jgi:predicted ATPase/DNA-binding NarL/FixJ family response regulator
MSNQKRALPVIEENILFFQRDGHISQLTVGSPAWYSWLNTASAFSFRSTTGTFTARREQAGHKRGGWYWRAYRKQKGKLHQIYMGKAQDLTLERLKDIAAHLAASCQPDPEQTSHSIAGIVRPPTRDALSTLPSPLTSLIGREPEIAAVTVLLAHPHVRLLTLTGTGGVGKTRLALAIAARMHDVFPDGVSFVSLAALRDASLVLPTIAQAQGLQGTGSQSLALSLQATLGEKRCLLVLDNFEHMMEAAPSLVHLLETSLHLKLLVTSREALHVRGEHEFVVQPLALPTPERLPDAETLAQSSALALFVERAREVRPTLALNMLTIKQMTEICRHLDGIPLALELAAARLKVLSLQALLERLPHRLHILTEGPRDLPTRQQTLRQTIAWSYDPLSDAQKHLFRLLAVFAGGCTLEALEEIYDRLGGERTLVLNEVTSLLDKHLLYQSEQGQRLLLHETIREYALEALIVHQELERAREVHAEYYLGLTQVHLAGVELASWLRQLECEHANLRAALQWAREQPASEMALCLERVLLRFWEGRHRLTHSQSDEQEEPVEIHSTSTIPARAQGDDEQSSGGEAGRLARLLYLLGLIAWIIGDFATAHMYTEEGLTQARGADEQITLAYLTDLSGQIALDQGEDMRARTLLEEGLLLHREAGDRLGTLNALFFLGRALLALDERTEAQTYTREHLALSREIGYQPGIISALNLLARFALEEGEWEQAHNLFTESMALLDEDDENVLLAVATNLQGIGVTLTKQRRLTEAVRLWGAAESICPLLPEERALVTRIRPVVRTELGEELFAAAWAEGQAMTLEQARAAMERIASSSQPPASIRGMHQQQSPLYELTAREEDVLRLVARGLSDAQVASALVISPRTVNAHLRSIYRKLQISSRNAATYFALKHNLI